MFDPDKRYKKGRRLARLIAWTPPLIFVTCAGVYLVSVARQVQRETPRLLSAAASLALRRQVTIGSVTAAPGFGLITLRNVAVSDAPTFAQGHGRKLVSAPRVTVALDAPSLVHDLANAGAYIRVITVYDPVGYVERRRGNQFNFSDFFKKPKRKKATKPFAAVIRVVDADVTFQDKLAPASYQPAVNRVRGVTGNLSFAAPHEITFAADVPAAANRFSAARVFGSLVFQPVKNQADDKFAGYDIHIDGRQANAPYFVGYFLQQPLKMIGRLSRGLGDVSLTLAQRNPGPKVPLDIVGVATVHGGSFTIANRSVLAQPLQDVAGQFRFTQDSLSLDAAGKVGGMPVHAVGAIASFKHPSLAFRGTAPAVIASRVHAALPFVPAEPSWLSGAAPASVTATAVGPLARVRFDVAVTSPSAVVYGVPLHALRGGLTFQGKSLVLHSLVASAAGGANNVALTGSFQTVPNGAARLLGHATGIDLAGVKLSGSLRKTLGGVTGIADADVRFASNGVVGTAAAAPLIVTARLRDGSVHGIPIEQAAAQITAGASDVRIDHAVAVQPDGAVVSLSGAAPLTPNSDIPLRLDFAASGTDLAQTTRQFGIKNLTGIAFLRGHIGGSFAAPHLTARANLFNATYGNIAVDHVRSDLVVTRDAIALTNGSVQRLGVSAAFNARVTGIAARHLRITANVSTRSAEIAALSLLATEATGPHGMAKLPASARAIAANAAGTLNADVAVSGALPRLKIAARVSVDSAVIDSLQIDRLQTTAELNGSTLSFPYLTAQIDGVNVAAAGALNLRTKAVRATAQANSADLSQQSAAAGLGSAISGSASARVIVGGTLTNPRAQVIASVASGKYKSIDVGNSQIALHYADGRLQSLAGQPLVIQSGPATYTMDSLDYDARRRTLALSADVKGEQIARLVGLARNLAPGNSPAAAALSRLPSGLAGQLDVPSFQLSGPLAKPNAHVAADVRGLTLGLPGENKLDVTSDASYSRGVATLTSLEARGPVEYLSASGSYAPHGAISAEVDASNFPLSLAHAANPALKDLGGNLSDFTLVASGTTAKPVINASVSLADVSEGGVSVDRIDSGRITVADDRISIAGLSLVKNEPSPAGSPASSAPLQHTALLQGYLPFRFSLENGVKAEFPAAGKLDLQASLPTQSVSLFTLFNPSLKALKLTGTVAGDVDLTGTLANKTINGAVKLANAAFQPPGFRTGLQNINIAAEFNGQHGTISSSRIQSSSGGYLTLGGTLDVGQAAPAAAEYASAAHALLDSLRLNLTASAVGFKINEPKVAALYNAGGSGVIDGEIHATGALLTPLVKGNLRVSKGSVTLPTVQPKVTAPAPPPPFNPSFALAIAVEPGTQVKSAQLNATVDGAVHIANTLYQPDVEGDFNIRKGRVNFYTANFRIIPTGSFHIAYNPPNDTVERVGVTATTSLNISNAVLTSNPVGASSLTAGEPYSYNASSVFSPVQNRASQRYTITVTIEGDLAKQSGLHLDFDSDPPGLTNEQILAALGGQQVLSSLLVGGNVQLALQTEAQQIFTGYALPTLLSPFEDTVAQVFGLEEIDVDYEPESPLLISVFKQIGPRLQVRYTRFVNSRQSSGAVGSTLTPLEYSVALDYYFTNKFRVDVSTDDQHNTVYSIGGAVNF